MIQETSGVTTSKSSYTNPTTLLKNERQVPSPIDLEELRTGNKFKVSAAKVEKWLGEPVPTKHALIVVIKVDPRNMVGYVNFVLFPATDENIALANQGGLGSRATQIEKKTLSPTIFVQMVGGEIEFD